MSNAEGVARIKQKSFRGSTAEELEEEQEQEEEGQLARPFWTFGGVKLRISSSESTGRPSLIFDGLEGRRCPGLTDMQETCLRVLTNWKFDTFIGVCIVINSAMVGIDQQFRLEARTSEDPGVAVIETMEHIFLCIYIIELAMRFFSLGITCLHDNWVKFDVVLVIVGVLNTWMLEILMGDSSDLGPLMVLRTGRLLRLARTVRLLVKFQVLWMLVRGLLTSAGTMLYTMVLLLVILYLFSCVGFELITNGTVRNNPEMDQIVQEWFPDLFSIMLTLLQFVCLDSVGSIYRPLIMEQPFLSTYFVCIILVVPIVLMNLVTAVIVNGAIEQSEQDKQDQVSREEGHRRKMILDMAKVLDDGGDGRISLEEIKEIGPGPRKVLYKLTGSGNPEDIFHALDVTNEGELDITEFCDGVWQVAISKVPLEMKRMEIQVNHIHGKLTKFYVEQEQFRDDQIRFRRSVEEILQETLHLLQGGASTAGAAPPLDSLPGDSGSSNAHPKATPEARTPRGKSPREQLTGKPLTKATRAMTLPTSLARSSDSEAEAKMVERGKLGADSAEVEAKLDDRVSNVRLEADRTNSSAPVPPRAFESLLKDIAGATELHVQRLQSIQQQVLQLRQEGGVCHESLSSSGQEKDHAAGTAARQLGGPLGAADGLAQLPPPLLSDDRDSASRWAPVAPPAAPRPALLSGGTSSTIPAEELVGSAVGAPCGLSAARSVGSDTRSNRSAKVTEKI